MKRLVVLMAALATAFALVAPAGAAQKGRQGVDPIPVDISHRLKDQKAPAQANTAESHADNDGATTGAQCGIPENTSLTITIPSFDPENPGSQDVVFWKQTAPGSGGSATLWVAWDFLETHYGRQDVITCDQLEDLQGEMDSIVATNVHYFGDYTNRPAGNENIDVMIYNIVDESTFDPDFPFYIAGFFWGSLNFAFDRNMIFIDSFDWENRLGPDAARPFLYEGVVAHELEHLIHHDHDPDEVSWIDEGMADLAEYLNGYGHPDGHVVFYLAFHRTPLTTWGGGLEDYGASYLFQLYLLENFGTKAGDVWDPGWTRTLIDEQANSIAGVEAATGAVAATEVNFNDLFDSWILANYVDDPSNTGQGGFPIGYDEIDLTPYVSPTFGPWSIQQAVKDVYGAGHHGNLPVDRYFGGFVSATVEFPVGDLPPYTALYGTYKGIQPELNFLLQGDTQSGVAPNSGDREVASGGGNLVIDRMLVLDQAVEGILTFATWYDIEEEWDYGFVEVSTDGGPWTPIAGNITTTSNNPNQSTAWANSLVGGQASSDAVITGSSGGWVDAEFTLPPGSNMVRFSYYTDEAVNGTGWFIDDVAVNGFSDDFEGGAGNWTLGGWEWTTGLFDNNWIAGYVNPLYDRGKSTGYDYDYIDEGVIPNGVEILSGSIDTSMLGKDEATVFFANRPGENPFAAGYLLLVDKGNASDK